jgi:hypothetical protein
MRMAVGRGDHARDLLSLQALPGFGQELTVVIQVVEPGLPLLFAPLGLGVEPGSLVLQGQPAGLQVVGATRLVDLGPANVAFESIEAAMEFVADPLQVREDRERVERDVRASIARLSRSARNRGGSL